MSAIRKVTVHLPDDLLEQAQAQTGEGITETIRQGLKLIAAARANRRLRAFRGKVTLGIDVTKLRDDR